MRQLGHRVLELGIVLQLELDPSFLKEPCGGFSGRHRFQQLICSLTAAGQTDGDHVLQGSRCDRQDLQHLRMGFGLVDSCQEQGAVFAKGHGLGCVSDQAAQESDLSVRVDGHESVQGCLALIFR